MNSPKSLSIIITASRPGAALIDCVKAIRESGRENADITVIACKEISVPEGCRTIEMDSHRCPASARDSAARQAAGDILLFVDADIVLSKEAIPNIEAAIGNGKCDALVGCCEKSPKGAPPFSAFKDMFTLWHHDQADSGKNIAWFWTGIGAIRQDVLEQEGWLRNHCRGAEDFEFGRWASEGGAEIVRRENVRGAQKRVHTLWSAVAAAFRGAADLTDFILRGKNESRKKIPFLDWRSKVNIPYAWFLFVTALLGAFVGMLWWMNIVSAVAALFYSFLINRRAFGFIGRGRMLLFGPFAFYCHVAAHIIAGLGILWGMARFVTRGLRKLGGAQALR